MNATKKLSDENDLEERYAIIATGPKMIDPFCRFDEDDEDDDEDEDEDDDPIELPYDYPDENP